MKTAADLRKIDYGYKDFIEQIRTEYGHTASSHAFVSLYLWQKCMNLSLLCEKDFFAVKCGGDSENMWFFPCGNPEKTYGFICENISDKSFSLCYLRDCDKEFLEQRFSGKWSFLHADESDEYICGNEEYINLAGGRFSEIRRKLRKIDRNFNVTVREISDETLGDGLKVCDKWYETDHSTGKNGLTDDMIAEKALNERKQLGINGIIMYADGIPVSVFAGFPLSYDTADVLIGKCTPDAPSGTAYYALHEYIKTLSGKFTYCNHEEDLGIEGIRTMKESLCPIKKARMWEAFLI